MMCKPWRHANSPTANAAGLPLVKFHIQSVSPLTALALPPNLAFRHTPLPAVRLRRSSRLAKGHRDVGYWSVRAVRDVYSNVGYWRDKRTCLESKSRNGNKDVAFRQQFQKM